jgi:drug/metabolite transporter (DMT)-like permease
LLFAAQIVATGLLARSVQFMVLVYMQITAAALCSLAAFIVTDRDFTVFFNRQALGPLLYLGILATFACYFLQTYAQRFISPAKAGIFLAAEALFGAVFSVIAGYDKPSPRMAAGGLIVFFSLILPDIWVTRKLKTLPKR